MIVSPVAQAVRNPGAFPIAGRARPLLDIAALCRRALIRNELLLTIAAAPRPAVDTPTRARPGRSRARIDRPDVRWSAGPGAGEPSPAPRTAARRIDPAGRTRAVAEWSR